MQTIILCGGRGERLMPLTAKLPASLLRIAGKELILSNMQQLVRAGASEITLALGYGAKEIKQLFESGDFEGVRVDFSSCSDKGTAAAVAYAADRQQEEIILLEGNTLFECDLKPLLEFHRKKGALVTALASPSADSEDCVRVCADNNSEAVSFVQNPQPCVSGCRDALCGIYVLSPDAFTEVSFGGERDFTGDILPELAKMGGRLFVYSEDIYAKKILTPKGFLSAQQNILYGGKIRIESRTDDNFSGVTFVPPVYIGKNVSIMSGSVVGRGSVIDDGARVDARCRVIGSYVGVNSVLSDYCECDGAVVCPGAAVGKRVKLGFNSVIGSDSVVESDCELAPDSAVWADTAVKCGVRVSGLLTHGSRYPAYIDDDGIFTFPRSSDTAARAAGFAMAVGSALEMGDKVLIGHSEKSGSNIFSRAIVCGLSAAGIDVLDMGRCTPQQTAYAIKKLKAAAGLFCDMKAHFCVRIMAAGGLPVKSAVQREIENAYSRQSFRSCPVEKFGRIFKIDGAAAMYEDYLKSLMPHKLKGVNAQVRTSSDIAAKTADRIFHSANDIGGERITFHLSQDGCGLSAYSSGAGNVSGEKLTCLGLIALFEKGLAAALPFCFPSSADAVAENMCGRLYRYYSTPIGESDTQARLTAENDDNLFVRDGLALCAAVCRYLSEHKLSLAAALADIPDFYFVERYVSSSCGANEVMDSFCKGFHRMSEGVVFENESSRAVIRPLKSAGGFKIFAESLQCEQATAVCDEICRRIKQLEEQKQR